MIPTGSRLLLSATVVSAVTALLYGTSNGGSLGTVGLIVLTVAFAVLSAVSLAIREADVPAGDIAAIEIAPAARRAPRPSAWPLVAALGAVLVVIGLVTYQPVFVIGLVAMAAAGVEWAVLAWSERASGSDRFNAEARSRLSNAIEFPVLGGLIAIVVGYAFSRIFLYVSKTGGPMVLGVAALLILGAGFLFAVRPAKGAAVYGVAGIGLVALVAAGAFSALQGERASHHVESTGTLAEAGLCDTAEHTHADERASQTVAATANAAAEVVLRDDDTLVAYIVPFRDPHDSVTLARSASSMVLFRNHSDHARRLVLDLGERPVIVDGNETDELMPNQLCTALVEPGGVQAMTFSIGAATTGTDNDFGFFVPGVDGQRLPVVVP